MDMNTLIESLYERDTVAVQTEKTAEAVMLNSLKGENSAPATSAEENPLMDLPMEDLIKMAQELGVEEVPAAEETVSEEMSDTEDLEKTAFDMLGGQVMAHSMVHEFGLMKQAMVNGYCRVCKETPMNVEGSSICSECLEVD